MEEVGFLEDCIQNEDRLEKAFYMCFVRSEAIKLMRVAETSEKQEMQLVSLGEQRSVAIEEILIV